MNVNGLNRFRDLKLVAVFSKISDALFIVDAQGYSFLAPAHPNVIQRLAAMIIPILPMALLLFNVGIVISAAYSETSSALVDANNNQFSDVLPLPILTTINTGV